MLITDSATPLYLQLKQILWQEILDGRWEDGQKIPTENVLVEQYQVSRVTVRKAVSELVKEGYLTRHPGKGTFVSKIIIQNVLDMPQGWTAATETQGYRPDTRCIGLETVCGEDVEAIYQQPVFRNTEYRKAVRIRSLNGRPLVYELDYFPSPEYDFVTKEMLCGSVFQLLCKEKQLPQIYEKETVICIAHADAQMAGFLGIREKTAMFHIRTVYLDGTDKTVFLSEQYINSERYEIRTGNHSLVLTE